LLFYFYMYIIVINYCFLFLLDVYLWLWEFDFVLLLLFFVKFVSYIFWSIWNFELLRWIVFGFDMSRVSKRK
jgi:hypothetical protein